MISMIPHLNQQGLCQLQLGFYDDAVRSFHAAAKHLHDHLDTVNPNPFFQASLSLVEISPEKQLDSSSSSASFDDHNTLRFLPSAFALEPPTSPSSSSPQEEAPLLSVECLSSALLYNMALSRHLAALRGETPPQNWVKAGRIYLMAAEAAQRAWRNHHDTAVIRVVLYLHNNWAHVSLQQMQPRQCQRSIQVLQFFLSLQEQPQQPVVHRGAIWMNTMLFTGRAPTAPAA